MDRRSFMKGSLLLGAAGITGLGLAGCNSSAQTTSADESAEKTEAQDTNITPDEVVDCDIVVVGMGVSGTSACVAAANKGAKVIGIDRAIGVAGTNIVNTVAIRGVASPDMKGPNFKELTSGAFYEFNNNFLSKYLDNIEECVELWKSKGVGLTFVPDPVTPAHYFDVREAERATQIQSMLDSFSNLTQMWRTEVTALIEDNGEITGVYATDPDGKVYQLNAKGGVIVGTGGFVHNADMVAQYMGGVTVRSYANQFNDGAGILLAQSAGGQIGKNFCFNCAEGGGVNKKSAEFNTYLFGTSGISRSPIIGDILLNQRGKRFCDEGVMVEKTAMFCGEPLTREGGKFYTVMTQKEIDQLQGKTILEYVKERYDFEITHTMIIMFFGQTPLTTIQKDADAAIAEGWCWKAASFEELEETSGLKNLAATMNEYNEMCAAGVDTLLYKEPNFLSAYAPEDGPYYLVEHEMPCWATQGGIKTDEDCHALTAECQIIPGLYVVGMDADIQSSPYVFGATAQGFSVGSGYLAALDAVTRA